MYDLTATIVTYNNKLSVLCKTIESFLNTSLNIRLYIADNSPTDRLRSLSESYSPIEYIFMNSNKGFGAGHNVVMKDSEKLGKYHLVLNPDIEFGTGVLENLYEFMEENKTVGNIMPKILYPSGETQYLCKLLPSPKDWIIRRFIPSKKIKSSIDYTFEMRFADYDQILQVPYLSGCFMFLRKEVIEEIGIFDENIFMYGEDTDLNRRIYKKYKTLYYPRVSIIHNFEKGSYKSFRLLWIHIKTAIYYFNKWGWFFDKERSMINKKTILHYKNK